MLSAMVNVVHIAGDDKSIAFVEQQRNTAIRLRVMKDIIFQFSYFHVSPMIKKCMIDCHQKQKKEKTLLTKESSRRMSLASSTATYNRAHTTSSWWKTKGIYYWLFCVLRTVFHLGSITSFDGFLL